MSQQEMEIRHVFQVKEERGQRLLVRGNYWPGCEERFVNIHRQPVDCNSSFEIGTLRVDQQGTELIVNNGRRHSVAYTNEMKLGELYALVHFPSQHCWRLMPLSEAEQKLEKA